MASVNRIELLNSTITSSTAGDPQTLEPLQRNFVAVWTITNFTGTTLDGDIEHSADGTNWETLVSFTQATGNTYESKQITSNLLPKVRINTTAVITTADVEVELYYDKQR